MGRLNGRRRLDVSLSEPTAGEPLRLADYSMYAGGATGEVEDAAEGGIDEHEVRLGGRRDSKSRARKRLLIADDIFCNRGADGTFFESICYVFECLTINS